MIQQNGFDFVSAWDNGEDLTDALINELTTKPDGPSRSDLLALRKSGARYCRERDSFIHEPVAFGNERSSAKPKIRHTRRSSMMRQAPAYALRAALGEAAQPEQPEAA